MDFATELRSIATRNEVGPRILQKRTGIHEQVIGDYLRGRRTPSRPRVILEIARAMGATTTEIRRLFCLRWPTLAEVFGNQEEECEASQT